MLGRTIRDAVATKVLLNEKTTHDRRSTYSGAGRTIRNAVATKVLLNEKTAHERHTVVDDRYLH